MREGGGSAMPAGQDGTGLDWLGTSFADYTRSFPRDVSEFVSSSVDEGKFSQFLEGDNAIAQLFTMGLLERSVSSAKSVVCYMTESGREFGIKDIYAISLVGEVSMESSILKNFGAFRQSEFVAKLGLSDVGQQESAYKLLRKWLGPDNPAFGGEEQTRLDTYDRRIGCFKKDPCLLTKILAAEIEFSGHKHESFMLLDHHLKLRYFGASLVIQGLLSRGPVWRLPLTDIFSVDLSRSFNILSDAERAQLEELGLSFGCIVAHLTSLQTRIRSHNALLVANRTTFGFDQVTMLNKNLLGVGLVDIEREILGLFPAVIFNEMKYRSFFSSKSARQYLSSLRRRDPKDEILHPLPWEKIKEYAPVPLRLMYQLNSQEGRVELPRLENFGLAGIDMAQRTMNQLFRELGIDLREKPVSSLFEGFEGCAENIIEAVLGSDYDILSSYLRGEVVETLGGESARSNFILILRIYIAYFEFHNIFQTAVDSRFVADPHKGLGIPSKNAALGDHGGFASSIKSSLGTGLGRGHDVAAEPVMDAGDQLPVYKVKLPSGIKEVVIDVGVFYFPLRVDQWDLSKLIFGPRVYVENGRCNLLSDDDITALGGIVITDAREMQALVSEVQRMNWGKIHGSRYHSFGFRADSVVFGGLEDVVAYFADTTNKEMVLVLSHINNRVAAGLFGKLDPRYGLLSHVGNEMVNTFEVLGSYGNPEHALGYYQHLWLLNGYEYLHVDIGEFEDCLIPSLLSSSSLSLSKQLVDLFRRGRINTIRLLSVDSTAPWQFTRVLDENGRRVTIGGRPLVIYQSKGAGREVFHKKTMSSEKFAHLVADNPEDFPLLNKIAVLNPDLAHRIYVSRKCVGFRNRYDEVLYSGVGPAKIARVYSLGSADELEVLGVQGIDELRELQEREYHRTNWKHFVVGRTRDRVYALGKVLYIEKKTERRVQVTSTLLFGIPKGLGSYFYRRKGVVILRKKGAYDNAARNFDSMRKFGSAMEKYVGIVNHYDSLLVFIEAEPLAELSRSHDLPVDEKGLWQILVRRYIGVPDPAYWFWDDRTDEVAEKVLKEGFTFAIRSKYLKDDRVNSYLKQVFRAEHEGIGRCNYRALSLSQVNLGSVQYVIRSDGRYAHEVISTALFHQISAVLDKQVLDKTQLGRNLDNWRKVVITDRGQHPRGISEYIRKYISGAHRENQGNGGAEWMLQVLAGSYMAPRTWSFSTKKLISPEDLNFTIRGMKVVNRIDKNRVFDSLAPVIAHGSAEHKILRNMHEKLQAEMDYDDLHDLMNFVRDLFWGWRGLGG